MHTDLDGTVVYVVSATDEFSNTLVLELKTAGLIVLAFSSLKDVAGGPPHVLVVDLEEEGLSIVQEARQRFPISRILAVSDGDDAMVRAAFAFGVHGFVSPQEPIATIGSAIILLARGGASLSLPTLQTLLRQRDEAGSERSRAVAVDRGLSARQVEVLELVARGFTDAEIANVLTISVRTVNRHVADILTKLGCDSRREAAAHIFGTLPQNGKTS